jgi:hypothetical protein
MPGADRWQFSLAFHGIACRGTKRRERDYAREQATYLTHDNPYRFTLSMRSRYLALSVTAEKHHILANL